MGGESKFPAVAFGVESDVDALALGVRLLWGKNLLLVDKTFFLIAGV